MESSFEHTKRCSLEMIVRRLLLWNQLVVLFFLHLMLHEKVPAVNDRHIVTRYENATSNTCVCSYCLPV